MADNPAVVKVLHGQNFVDASIFSFVEFAHSALTSFFSMAYSSKAKGQKSVCGIVFSGSFHIAQLGPDLSGFGGQYLCHEEIQTSNLFNFLVGSFGFPILYFR